MSIEPVPTVASIESDLAEVIGAEAVLGIVRQHVLQRLSDETAALFKIPADRLASYRIYALSFEEDEALHHAILHLGDAVRRLDQSYRTIAQAGDQS